MDIAFGIKDAIDIFLLALLLFYLYRIMRESGTLSIFFGILAFIAVWVVTSEILGMRLIGTILDKFMSIGLLILVILFQDQIKRFLVVLGSQKRWKFIGRIFKRDKAVEDETPWIMPLVNACMNMSRTKTGALIVIEKSMSLISYEKTGDAIDAAISSRLLQNIFFKNSPLHDGAVIISEGRINAAGCILPVSHDSNIPRRFGLRHRSAIGISEATDAVVVIVSEETGGISVAYKGNLNADLSSTELEHLLADLINEK
ncbi:MAG: diadenylate cyclase CdaA [Muribaculaceae bacterium]|nr:diadenylate cyclase CdaA [Muribaculaceae bacterium]MBP5315506.1 diadenylate cyclase CdaA [Muribaculaceae bacterium]MBR4722310.1 diadenylate cyclase CdaA [Muribaculaceae bacterium]MBR5437077.1 diadenylate cyclase CdaA [Muribaculaceae bacterium]MBR5744102.1 diadenylate cyclase CdaA [Muribaculaceae bacterium]